MAPCDNDITHGNFHTTIPAVVLTLKSISMQWLYLPLKQIILDVWRVLPHLVIVKKERVQHILAYLGAKSMSVKISPYFVKTIACIFLGINFGGHCCPAIILLFQEPALILFASTLLLSLLYFRSLGIHCLLSLRYPDMYVPSMVSFLTLLYALWSLDMSSLIGIPFPICSTIWHLSYYCSLKYHNYTWQSETITIYLFR